MSRPKYNCLKCPGYYCVEIKDHGSYWIVRAMGSKESAPARAFREWLMSEMAETQKKFAQIKAQGKRPS